MNSKQGVSSYSHHYVNISSSLDVNINILMSSRDKEGCDRQHSRKKIKIEDNQMNINMSNMEFSIESAITSNVIIKKDGLTRELKTKKEPEEHDHEQDHEQENEEQEKQQQEEQLKEQDEEQDDNHDDKQDNKQHKKQETFDDKQDYEQSKQDEQNGEEVRLMFILNLKKS